MRSLVMSTVLLVFAVGPLLGQDPAVRRRLQQQVVERFMTNYRVQVALTEEQYVRFQEVTQRSFRARAEFEQRERRIWVALQGQMRPGVAADPDSLNTLMDALIQVQADRVEQARTEQAEYAEFLTPVQRAQLTLSWRRLQGQIEQVRQRMRGRRPPGM